MRHAMTPSFTGRPAAAPGTAPPRLAVAGRVSTTGKLFIAVMLILIYEGAVRKWVSNAMSTPLIGLRDLLVVFTIGRAFWLGHFARLPLLSRAMLLWTCCVVGWGLLQLTLGESTFTVFLIGLRFWLLSFWFAVAAAAGMNERDYVVALRVLMLALLLMAPLVALQRQAPPESFINKSLGDDVDEVFQLTAGVVRTTGTFSFTAGFVTFAAMCAPFALGIFEARKTRPRHRILAAATFAALIVCTLVSGARASFLFLGGLLFLYLVGNLAFSPMRQKGRAMIAAVVAICLIGALAFVFSDALRTTQERFESAAQTEGIAERLVTTLVGEASTYDRADWLGAGIGIGSNLAGFARFSSRAVFTFGETEQGRSLIEGGLLGALFIVLKLIAIGIGVSVSIRQSLRTRAIFPVLVWLTLGLALTTWPVIGQLTAHGLIGILLALGLLTLRYPRLRFFD